MTKQELDRLPINTIRTLSLSRASTPGDE